MPWAHLRATNLRTSGWKPAPLPLADAAGSQPLSLPHAGTGQRRSEQIDLLHPDCRSLSSGALPVLPETERIRQHTADGQAHYRELLHIRHYSLFAPRDFDTLPYFAIIKPTIECRLDPHAIELSWQRAQRQEPRRPLQ